MKTTVVYFSKTGNTKIIAESIAKALECDSFQINLMKKGRKTKQEIEEEKLIINKAIEQSNQSDLVFIGTPTEFRKPHAKVVDFINTLSIKKAAIFCTYYGMLGATFYDLEAILLNKNISIAGKLSIRVGTEKYRFNLDISQYKERISSEHIQAAVDFAIKTVTMDKPLPIRLKGVCGANCEKCDEFNKSCKGSGYSCCSNTHCKIFDCCVLKKSFLTCDQCNNQNNCYEIKNRKIAFTNQH